MPVKLMTREIRRRMACRAYLFGPPNSFKTTAIVATAVYPLHVVSCPGETGWATIPDGVPGLSAYVWEEPPGDPVGAGAVKKEVEDTVFQILAQKHGACRTLAIEGFHKLYNVYLDIATDGNFGRGEEFESIKYGRAHQMAYKFLGRVLASTSVEYIIVTSWNAKEADIPGQRQGTSHEYPNLPGQMAKMMAGMFSGVLFAKVTPPLIPGGPAKGEWLLKPDHEVWGSSVKMDPRVISKLPARMAQSFKEYYKIVGAAEDAVAQEETNGPDSPAVA